MSMKGDRAFFLGLILGSLGMLVPDAYTSYQNAQDNPQDSQMLLIGHIVYWIVFIAVLYEFFKREA
jgi:hypothetical protein